MAHTRPLALVDESVQAVLGNGSTVIYVWYTNTRTGSCTGFIPYDTDACVWYEV